MNKKRVGKLVLIIIILFLGFTSFQRYTGFIIYKENNITIPETFIQNLNVENVKLYDTNNNGLIDKVEPESKFIKVDIKDSEKQRVIISFNDDSYVVKDLSNEDIENLLKNPNVETLSLDYKFNLTLQNTIPLINASLVHSIKIENNITGSSESVCILDSGIYSKHEAFTNKIIAQKCYADDDFPGNENGYCVNNTEESDSAEDDIGHGTLVAGIVGASIGIKGVAPDSKIVAVKICNYMGQCQYSDLIKGINFCVDNKEKYNISVITLSLGTGYVYSDYASCNLDNIEITNSINNAFLHGIFIDSSSGNSHSSTGISAPACLYNVTSVGATDKNDNIAYYSNIGSLVSVLAPGSNINSTTCIGSGSLCSSSGYTNRFSGTSFSSPHVAGSVVLLIQYTKEKYNYILLPNEIKNILKESGKNIYYNNQNYSRINILNAVNYIDSYLNESFNVWTDLDKGIKEYMENVTFYANLTRLDKIIENSSCDLYFENNSYLMNLNENLFEYSLNINEFKDYNFSINCSYENKNISSYNQILHNEFKFYLNHSVKIFLKNYKNESLSDVNLLIYEFNNSDYLYNLSVNDGYILNITEFLFLNNSFVNKTPHEIIIYYNNFTEERNLNVNKSFLEESSENLFLINTNVENITNTTEIIQLSPSSSVGSSGGSGKSSTKKEIGDSVENKETRMLEQPEQKDTRVLEIKKAIEKQITTEEKNYDLYYAGSIFIFFIAISSVLYLFFRKKKFKND